MCECNLKQETFSTCLALAERQSDLEKPGSIFRRCACTCSDQSLGRRNFIVSKVAIENTFVYMLLYACHTGRAVSWQILWTKHDNHLNTNPIKSLLRWETTTKWSQQPTSLWLGLSFPSNFSSLTLLQTLLLKIILFSLLWITIWMVLVHEVSQRPYEPAQTLRSGSETIWSVAGDHI